MSWKEDPRWPYAFAALVGMIAGIAAKQAVTLQTGHLPKASALVADVLVLGMIWLIVMYIHGIRPGIPLEGIALISAALAMWGPKGISALLLRFQKGALNAADTFAKSVLDPVEPVHRPTVIEAVEKERIAAMPQEQVARENRFAEEAPIRKLRDVIVPETKLPIDQVELLGKADEVAPDYHPPSPKERKKKKKESE